MSKRNTLVGPQLQQGRASFNPDWKRLIAFLVMIVLGSIVATQVLASSFGFYPALGFNLFQRFSNIMESHDYASFPGFQDDARKRKWNFWGYIDARDSAQAVRLALEAKIKGADVFIIANADTVMERDSKALLAEVFPDVPHKRSFGPQETLLSIEKARKILGYEPKYSWRSEKFGS